MTKAFAKRFLPVLIVTGAVSLAAAGGCGSGGGTSSLPPVILPSASPSATPDPSEAVTTTGRFQSLFFTLTTPKHSYAVGETVPLTFTVQNTDTTDVTIGAASPYIAVGDVYDGVGAYAGSLAYRSSSRTTSYSQTILPAGQTKTFLLEWSRQGNNVTPFDQTAPGSYSIRTYLSAYTVDYQTPTPTDLGTAPLSITVQ